MKRLTAQWIRKAEKDMAAARSLLTSPDSLYDAVCFHSQQATEKYFKALLQDLSLHIPKIHDLEDLLDLLLPSDPTLSKLRRGLDQLTLYAVDYRYPGFVANGRKAKTAIR